MSSAIRATLCFRVSSARQITQTETVFHQEFQVVEKSGGRNCFVDGPHMERASRESFFLDQKVSQGIVKLPRAPRHVLEPRAGWIFIESPVYLSHLRHRDKIAEERGAQDDLRTGRDFGELDRVVNIPDHGHRTLFRFQYLHHRSADDTTGNGMVAHPPLL